MSVKLIKRAKSKELLNNISNNLELYRNGSFDYLISDFSNSLQTSFKCEETKLYSIMCNENDDKEVENCILIYNALGDLSHYLARDERLWVYLTHTHLLDYSRKRWPVPSDDEQAIKHIRNHFFVVGARGFERDNAASRLWWMASLCSRVHELSLKEALASLLFQYDVRANIIERPETSQNIHIFSAILKKLHASLNGDKTLFERKKFRTIMKELNLCGGNRLLSVMSEIEIEQILDELILNA